MFIAPLGFFAGASESFPDVTNALPNNSSDSGWIDMTDNAILWHFDETTGNFTDSSGNNRTGTKYNLTQGNPGIHGKLVNFPGNGSGTAGHQENSYNRVDASYGVTSGSTIMMWVKGTEGTLWTIADTNLQFPLSLDFDSSSTILKFAYHGNVTLNTHLGDNEWHHLAIYLGASETKIYVDGSLDVSSTSKTWGGWNTALSGIGYWETPTIFTLGCYRVKNLSGSDCSDPFSGKVDEFAIFERELGLWEINNAYRGYKYNSVPPTITVSQTNNGTNQATITVTITDTDSVASGWAWKTSAFGSVGAAHGGTVGTGTSATITGLSQSLHTIHVVLFDGSGNIVAGLDGSASTANVNVDLRDLQTLVRTDLNRYYHFNGNLNDYSGNGNHASMGAGTATYGTDKWNQQAFVPKDNAIVNSGHPMMSTDTTYSIATWVYSDTNKTNALICLNSVHYSTWGPGGIYVNFGGTTANASGFFYRYSNSNVTPYSCAIPALATGQWHHIVAVQNGSTMQVWVNGTKETEITNATNAPFATSNPMYIGGMRSVQSGQGGYGGEAIDVKIDEFAYWTKSLTQGEIEYLWNSGAGRHIYDPDSTVDASVSVSGDTVNISVTIGDPANNATGGWAYSTSPLGAVGAAHGGTAVSSGTTAQITGVSDGSYTLYYGLIDSSGNVVVKGSTAYVVGLTAGLVLKHDCDDATADTGSSNATLTNVTSAAVLGRDAWNFSGQTSTVLLDSNRPSFSANSNWTYSLWFYNLKSNGGTAWRTALRSDQNVGGHHPIIVGYNNNNLGYYVGGTGFVDSGFDMVHTDYTGWNHMVAVGDGSTTKYYVNGSLVGSVNHNPAIDIYSIGNYQSNNQQFADAVGDVRVWNRSLTASDISQLYTSSLVLYDGRNAQYVLDFNSDDGIGSNDLTETGTWTFTQTGNYRAADTSQGSLDTTNAVDVNNRTFSMWIKHDGGYTYYSNDYKAIFMVGDGSNHKGYVSLLNNKLRIQFANGSGGWTDVRDTLAITQGTWNHYAISFDSSNGIKVYLNGNLRLTDTGTSTSTYGAQTLYYGGGTSAPFRLNGEIDDIQTWNRLLSATEVSSLNSAGRTTSISLTTGLTHRWSLDSDGAPAVGTGTFTASNGVTHVTANGRSYASFPNRNSSYWINSPFIDLPNSYTMSFWFKDMNSRSGAQGNFLMATINGNANNGGYSSTIGYDIVIYHNDELGAWGSATSGASHSHRTTGFSMVSTDYQGWHHMAMVMDNGTATYYVDGVQAGNSVSYIGQQKIQVIGSLAGYNYGMAQAYDDFRLWNRALAASEILELKETTHVIEDDLVAHYELDGDADAAVGSVNGTVNGATFATVDSKQHADFDGNDTISIGNLGSGFESGTISFWYNSDSISDYRCILSTNPSGNNNMIRFEQSTTYDNLAVYFGGSSSYGALTYQASGLSTGTWYHVVFTWDSTRIRGYLNGVEKFNSTDSTKLSQIPSSISNLTLGNGFNTSSNRYYDGQIDDVKVWKRTLSAAEASSQYSAGRPTLVYTPVQVNGYYPLYTVAAGAELHSGGNGTYHTHVFGGVTYYMPNGLTLGTTQFHGTYGQVAGYNFDSANANDSIGSNNGTATNITYATAGGRTYAEANGSNNKIDLGNISALNFGTGDFSACAWVYLDSTPTGTSGARIIGKGMTSNSSPQYNGFSLDHYNGNVRFMVGGGGSYSSVTTPQAIGEWFHVVATRSGTSMKVYINGTLAQSGTASSTFDTDNTYNASIFAAYNGIWYDDAFDGKMDDIRVYNRELPASEAQYIYESTIQLTDGMVAKYRLDYDANDSVGTVNGTATGATFSSTETGKRSALFDGSNDYINLTDNDVFEVNATDSRTFSLWFKLDSSAASSWMHLLNKRNVSSNNTGWALYKNSTDKLEFALVSGGSALGVVTTNSALSNNTWYHVAVTVDRTNDIMKIYLNGTLQTSTASLTSVGSVASTNPLYMGWGDNVAYFDGSMDDFRVWERALSASEISSLNSAGREDSRTLTTGLVAHYNLDSDASATVGTNGTNSGATFTTAGNLKYADFDGSNDSISLPHGSENSFGTGDFAVSMWINPDTVAYGGTNQGTLWSKGYTNLELYIYDSKVRAYMGGASNGITHNTNLSTGTWQHVVLTRIGTDVKLYVNGVASNTIGGSPGSANLSGTNNAVYLGYRNGGSTTWYNGKMDEVKHWNRGLVADEVTDLYNAGHSGVFTLTENRTGYWRLETDAQDYEGSNNGTVSGATFSEVSGKSFASFDGNDSIAIPHDANHGFNGNNVSVSVWIKTTSTQNDTIWIKGYGGSGGDSLFTMEINNGSDTNKARLFWRNSAAGGSGTCISTTSVNDGYWHHLLAVRDGSTLKLYVDGTLEDTATGLSGNFTGQLFYLGKWDHQSYSAQNFYTGDMDDLQVWDRSLFASEAATLHSNGRPNTYTGRVFNLSPSISGKSTWNLDTDGQLAIPQDGAQYSLTPTSTFTVNVKMWGAGGGHGSYSTGGNAGGGGFTKGDVAFQSGSVYYAYAATKGGSAGPYTNGGSGGLPGGGYGSRGDASGGGGGGYSGLFKGYHSQAGALLIAGGGGGGTGYSTHAGAGGGATAGNGGGGAGGSQTAGGNSGQTYGGSALQGGNARGGQTSGTDDGGGGGGGYYGGGGGYSDARTGGGGSGFVSTSSEVTNATTTAGSGHTPAGTSDSDYSNYGKGGASGGSTVATDGYLLIKTS